MVLRVRKNPTPPPPPVCALSECMGMLSGAWAANVLWYLASGPRRFSELRRDIPRVSAKVLSARLRAHEERGLIERHIVDTSPPSVEYRLAELGRELLPALRAIVAVGEKLKQRGHVPKSGHQSQG